MPALAPQARSRRVTNSPAGRPIGSGLTYTAEHAERVLLLLSQGHTLHYIATIPDMPTVQLVSMWANGFSNPPIAGFAERYVHARRSQCAVWADEIIEISDEAPGMDMAGVAAAKLRTDNRKWILSKLHPEIYGDRLQVTGNTGGGSVVNVYLPAKGALTDGARVQIDGQAVDISEQSGVTGT